MKNLNPDSTQNEWPAIVTAIASVVRRQKE